MKRKRSAQPRKRKKSGSVHVKSRSDTYTKVLVETDKRLTAHELEQLPVSDIIEYKSSLLNNKVARMLNPSGNNI